MPRDGSGVYTQPFPDVVAGTTIESAKYNGNVNDVEQDLNTPRPIVAGGTGSSSAEVARFNLAAEAAAQVVTSYDSHIWLPGSFRSAAGAAGAPTANAFAGVCYLGEALANPPTNANVVLEARDLGDASSPGVKYIREKIAGVWSAWTANPTTESLYALFVRYDAAQALTPAQQSQARANIDVTQKNYIINGAMMISQENGTAAGTTTNYYPADEFCWIKDAGVTGISSIQQVASGTPGGSPFRIWLAVTAADASVAATDNAFIDHRIEGFRAADLKFGSASAKTVTLQFGVRAPAGTYGVTLINAAADRAYVAEYVISAGEANIDVVRSVTIPGDTTSTWRTDNGIGMYIRWGLMTGSGAAKAPGSWGGIASGTINQFNVMGTVGNNFQLFDVSLTEGTVAPPFTVPDYASELAACQRYFQKKIIDVIGYAAAGNYIGAWFQHYVMMRSTPTVSTLGGSFSNTASIAIDLPTSFGCRASIQATGAGTAQAAGVILSADARL